MSADFRFMLYFLILVVYIGAFLIINIYDVEAWYERGQRAGVVFLINNKERELQIKEYQLRKKLRELQQEDEEFMHPTWERKEMIL